MEKTEEEVNIRKTLIRKRVARDTKASLGRTDGRTDARVQIWLQTQTSCGMETAMDDCVAEVAAAVAAYRRRKQRIKKIDQLPWVLGLHSFCGCLTIWLQTQTSCAMKTAMDDCVAEVVAAVAAYRRRKQRIKNIDQLPLVLGLLDEEDGIICSLHFFLPLQQSRPRYGLDAVGDGFLPSTVLHGTLRHACQLHSCGCATATRSKTTCCATQRFYRRCKGQ